LNTKTVTVTVSFNKFIFHMVLAVFFAWLGNTQQDNIFGIINWVIGVGYGLVSIMEAIVITSNELPKNEKIDK